MASIKIREVPEYAKPIVYAFGFATINWGKMEQALEMLLQSRPRKSAQDAKWSFCLTTGTLCPANQERP
jgi:hypothetical protein